MRCKSFQICADARATTRVKSRDGQQNRRRGDSLTVEMAHSRPSLPRSAKKIAGYGFLVRSFPTSPGKTAGICECTRTEFPEQVNSLHLPQRAPLDARCLSSSTLLRVFPTNWLQISENAAPASIARRPFRYF